MTNVKCRIELIAAGCYLLMLIACSDQTNVVDLAVIKKIQASAPNARKEWRHYLKDKASSQYSPLDQINTTNVQHLDIAWTYDSKDAAAGSGSQVQCNPIIVKGILYGTTASHKVFALNAATGEELWVFKPEHEDFNSNRGVAYWQEKDEQRIFFTLGYFLYAINALTGKLEKTFGQEGRVDMREGLRDTPLEQLNVVATSPGTVFQDLLILGSRVSEFSGASPGHIRAFDVRAGEIRWIFHTIPYPGEYGYETWSKDSWVNVGGANSWPGIAIDEERGMAFVPTGSPAFDFYGADRIGDNLFANSLIALGAKTGKRIWHYQFIRHDLWDRDLPATPNLITIKKDGQTLPAIAQITKTGHTFIFHRETGEPLFPIKEEPVYGKPSSGEVPAKSQPLPTAPPPFASQKFQVTNRTPQAKAAIEKRMLTLHAEGSFNLPSEKGALVYPGIDGGAEWGGAAYDEAHGMLYVNSNNVPHIIEMKAGDTTEKAFSSPAGIYHMNCAGCHGSDKKGDDSSIPSLENLWGKVWPWQAYQIVRKGRGRMPALTTLPPKWVLKVLIHIYNPFDSAPNVAEIGDTEKDGTTQVKAGTSLVSAGWQKFVDPEGFPASKPPWGLLTAIDLNRAKIAWQIPLGNYPKLLTQGKTGLGSENYGGPIATAGGVLFIAATPDEKLRAFDKTTGELLWEDKLPAAGFATPATYQAQGKQFLVVAAGGGKLNRPSGSQYIAYALPD